MAKLPRFDLVKNNDKDAWDLERKGRVVKRFETKSEATAGGVLEGAVGKGGGTVRIHLEVGRIQEERTYPGSRDPKKSPG